MVFRPKNFNTRGQHELELAATWAEPENQTELVTGPDRDKIKNFKFFFQKTKSGSMPDHNTKGQPAASTYVRKKGRVTFDTNRDTPCIRSPLTKRTPQCSHAHAEPVTTSFSLADFNHDLN